MNVRVHSRDPRDCGCQWFQPTPGRWLVMGEHTCPLDSAARTNHRKATR